MKTTEKFYLWTDAEGVTGPYDFEGLVALWGRGMIPLGAKVSGGDDDWQPVAALATQLETGACELQILRAEAHKRLSPAGVWLGVLLALVGGVWLRWHWVSIEGITTADELVALPGHLILGMIMVVIGIVFVIVFAQRRGMSVNSADES
jgi:hypothetical protein